MRSIRSHGAFEAVASVCACVCVRALWFLDQQIQTREKVPTCSFTSSWLTGCLVGLRCTRVPVCGLEGYALWNSPFKIAHTHKHTQKTHTHTSSFPRQEVQAIYNHQGHRSPLFAIWSEARIVPPVVGVCLCLCSRVSNISTDCRHMQAWLYWLRQDLKSVETFKLIQVR